MMIILSRINQIQELLDEVLRFYSAADHIVSGWLRTRSELGGRDRSEIVEAIYNILRHLRRYRHFAESGKGALSRRLAILGLQASVGNARILPALNQEEIFWLQQISLIDLATLPWSMQASLPDWLAYKLANLEQCQPLLDALNQPAPLDIRINSFKAKRDEILAEWLKGAESKFSPQACPYSPWGIRLTGRPPVNQWPSFKEGIFEIQDEASQLLALLVAPKRGEMVIDFCAGAGGKTLSLGAMMRSTGRLYAFDTSAKRLARAKPRLARSGLSNVTPIVIQHENDPRIKRLANKAHRVLVDAPCSGIGTLRRNPDIKWRQSPEALVDLRSLQTRILTSAARCVRVGGRLVYATCSLLSEENEHQVEDFLKSYSQFELLNVSDILQDQCPSLKFSDHFLHLRPDWHHTDGFFAAVFERKI